MSLKDRLNTAQKTANVNIKQTQETQVQYYNNSETANNVDSLGALDTLLFDDDLNSIFASGAKNIYVERNGRTHKSTSTFRDNIQLVNIIKKSAQNIGLELTSDNLCFKFNQELGINVIATLPPLSNVPTLFLKAYKDKHGNIQNMQENLIISKEIALILEALCAIKKNILITGEKNTLKTTLLSALAKKVPSNNRAIVIDTENEFRINKGNYTNYDFSKIKDDEMSEALLTSIINSSTDKVIVNSDDKKLQYNIIDKIQKGYNGVITSITAQSPQEGINEIAKIIAKNTTKSDFEIAKQMAYQAFDIIIHVKKDDLGKRKIYSISQINPAAINNQIKDIFVFDYTNEHKSTGITPNFFEDIKNNSLPINDNIFDESYKHTYHKIQETDSMAQFVKKGANIDILKKFKKDLPTINQDEPVQETQDINKKEQEQVIDEQKQVQIGEFKAEIIDNLNNINPQNEQSPEELMKKAQDKFNELKKSAQVQDNELNTSPIEE